MTSDTVAVSWSPTNSYTGPYQKFGTCLKVTFNIGSEHKLG